MAKNELSKGLKGLIGIELKESVKLANNSILVGTPKSSEIVSKLSFANEINNLDREGYIIREASVDGKKTIVITAKEDIGILYGVFHFLRLMQTNSSIDKLSMKEEPKLQYRVLNHWDNLNGTIERGYAGYTLWVRLGLVA